MVRFLVAVMFLAGTVLEPKSCSVNFGGGSDNPSAPSGFNLSVPFFAQDPNFQFCGPASIEMWAAYDGVTATQQQIANYIGCSVTHGAAPAEILSGTQHFTVSGHDAALLFGASDPTIAGQYYSAEITSITGLIPLIPLVNGATHGGVLTGGQWHIDTDTNLYVWDTVFFSDPLLGPGVVFDAGSWTGYDDIEHIISSSASVKGGSNYWTYHTQVAIRGAGGGIQRLPY